MRAISFVEQRIITNEVLFRRLLFQIWNRHRFHLLWKWYKNPV
jgi:hypothetical protein